MRYSKGKSIYTLLLLLLLCLGCIPGFIETPPDSDSAKIFLETVEEDYVYLYDTNLDIAVEKERYGSSGSTQIFDALIRSFIQRAKEIQFRVLQPYAFRYDEAKNINYDGAIIQRDLAYLSQHGNFSYARVRDYTSVGYLHISSLEQVDDFVNAAIFRDRFLIDAGSELKAVIIDLRSCSSGAVEDIDGLLDYFLDKERTYFKYRLKAGAGASNLSAWREIYAKPKIAWNDQIPIVVLVGGRTRFAAEWMAAALDAAPYTTLIGDTTAGELSLLKYFEMPNGYVYQIPTWEVRDLQGDRIEGRGITPLLVTGRWKTHHGRDSILSLATGYLTRRYGIKSDY